ncbi:MAG: alpha/beta hydrolase [Chitinophagaceae bacterium]|nr:alpha/beta hydrolase [Chitinophagaceae bacterium]
MKRILRVSLKIIIVIFLLVNVVVAFHAYKFTHFYNRGEIAVKENTEKSGWDKTKEILFGINAVKKQNTVIADSTFQNITLITKDGLKLAAWYIPADSAFGTVLLFHGHGGTRSDVIKESESFNKMGYNTLLVDFRAHGNSEGNTCTIGYDETEDVKLAYDFIKNKGENNVVLWGISMGASTITKAVKDYQLEPKKVILEMPFGTIEDAVVGRVKMMGLPPQPVAALLTFWGGAEHGFWAFGMKPQEFVASIKCPVLLQWGRNDPRVSRSEEDILFSHIANENKKWVVYETAAHESLCKKEPGKWNTEVAAFLK